MNNYTICYTNQFREELKNAYYNLYFYLNSSRTAKTFLNKVKQFISRLDLFPERYSKIPYYSVNSKNRNLRKMPVDKYIIIYEVNNDTRSSFHLTYFS